MSDSGILEEICPEGLSGRFDSVLFEVFGDELESRSRARKLIEDGSATLNGSAGKPGANVKPGDVLRLQLPEPEPLETLPEDIPLDIVYEDSWIVVVNKPRGMVVHPAPGNTSGTLVNALLYHCTDLSGIGGVLRPGIVHRIDKETTGLIVAAKNDQAHVSLSEQLKTREMHRIYIAAAEGRMKTDEGEICAPIGRSPKDRKKMAVVAGGRYALTRYKVLENSETHPVSLLELSLDTGRTHQIRVHLSHIGHPVVGDPVYGRKDARGMDGQALHAGRLMLRHPDTGELMVFSAPLPEDMHRLLGRLGLSRGEEKFCEEN